MTTRNMLIIKDARGAIIAAHLEDPADSGVATYIHPTQADHTLHRVSDVPAEIHGIAHPEEFHKAMTKHVNSSQAKIKPTNVDELHAAFVARLKK
jgi:hypothetical protein